MILLPVSPFIRRWTPKIFTGNSRKHQSDRRAAKHFVPRLLALRQIIPCHILRLMSWEKEMLTQSFIKAQAILCHFLGWLSDPFGRISDLQLGDKKVTLNHLEFFFWKKQISKASSGLTQVLVIEVYSMELGKQTCSWTKRGRNSIQMRIFCYKVEHETYFNPPPRCTPKKTLAVSFRR